MGVATLLLCNSVNDLCRVLLQATLSRGLNVQYHLVQTLSRNSWWHSSELEYSASHAHTANMCAAHSAMTQVPQYQ